MSAFNRKLFRFPVVFALLLLAGVATLGTAAAEPSIGEPAPDFTAIDSTGRTHRLSAYRGKRVILEWTNHDCPFVGKHYRSGNMQRTQKAATEDGAVWLSVISSAPGLQGHVSGAEADTLTRNRNAYPTAVLLDPSGKVGRLYRARVTPHIFIVDKDGRLAYKGAIDSIPSWDEDDIPMATNYVGQALDQLKAGQPVKPTITRPYGCSVKYTS
jgi:hypothetical protein